MFLFWNPPVSPKSVRACELGTSSRNYDCEHCEHFKNDCRFADRIAEARESGDFRYLPKSLQLKLIGEIMDETEAIAKEVDAGPQDPESLLK